MFPTTISRFWAPLLMTAGALLTGCASEPAGQSSEERNPAGVPVVTITPQPAAPAPAPAPKEPTAVAAATPAPVTTGSVAPASPLPALAPVAAPAPAAAPATPAKASTPAPAPAKAPVHKSGPLAKGFYINAGLFAVASNANNAYHKLEAAGLPVFTEVVKKKSGPLTRVRVGPYTTRAKAEAAAGKIKALKLDAAVFKH